MVAVEGQKDGLVQWDHGWIVWDHDPVGSWQKDGCAIGPQSRGALGVAGEVWGALGYRTCGSVCHQHRAGAPPASLLFLALCLGIGFQAGISGRAERGRGQRALLQHYSMCFVIPCCSAREWPLSCPFQGFGGACQGLPARAEDVSRSPCSFLFAWPSTVSFSNSFLFFLHFAAQIKDFPARRWQGKLILLLLFA